MLTTCPLDCFDTCSVEVDENFNLSGELSHPITKGYLCSKLNNYHKFPRIQSARLNGKDISINEAVSILKEKKDENTLYFKGSGNLGVMQSVTKLAFKNATFTKGSLCEKAGSYGIREGRGVDLALSPLHVAKSEVVVVWGRNPTSTNAHMDLEGKTLIVIDPYKTKVAKKADLHVSIKPKGDIYLAMLLAKIAYMEQLEDVDFIEKRSENFDYFIDFVNSKPMVELEKKAGVSIDDAYKIIELIKGKKVSFLVGVGVQKYSFGHSVLRAIDSFVAMLGLFGEEGCGVGYVAESSLGFANPFSVKTKEVSLPLVEFSDYDLVFIQGANPANQMPNSSRVKDSLKKAKFVVYFGLYENETSKLADLVIPAKTFLEKEDLKFSYGHEYIGFMPKIKESKIGISEYKLALSLGADLKSEKEYIDEIVESNSTLKNGRLISKIYEKYPYKDEFYTDSKKFEFFDDFEESELGDEGFFLLNSKLRKSINSQFETDQFLHVPISLNLKDNDKITLSSGDLSCEYIVKNDENLRDDCLLIYSGHINANAITPSIKSQEGECAIYQELKCKIISF